MAQLEHNGYNGYNGYSNNALFCTLCPLCYFRGSCMELESGDGSVL